MDVIKGPDYLAGKHLNWSLSTAHSFLSSEFQITQLPLKVGKYWPFGKVQLVQSWLVHMLTAGLPPLLRDSGRFKTSGFSWTHA